jgi:hypothetical protein
MNNVEKRWGGALQSRACGALNNLGSERSHLLTDKCVLAPALCGRSVNFFCPVLAASLCDGTGILITRIVGYSLMASWLFRCGPDIEELLLPEDR